MIQIAILESICDTIYDSLFSLNPTPTLEGPTLRQELRTKSGCRLAASGRELIESLSTPLGELCRCFML